MYNQQLKASFYSHNYFSTQIFLYISLELKIFLCMWNLLNEDKNTTIAITESLKPLEAPISSAIPYTKAPVSPI